MTRTTIGYLVAGMLAVGACGGKADDAVRSAADAARGLAGTVFGSFKVDSEHLIAAGDESPVKVTLEADRCYRFVAYSADPAPLEEVSLSFKHSESVVEMGSDFLDLTVDDGDLRNKRVVWGVCVWPSLEGELEIYSNLATTGGAVLVLSASVKKLSWKDGKDVRLYLKATGDVDVEALEREEVTPGLEKLLEDAQPDLPEGAKYTKADLEEIVNTTQGTWKHEFTLEPKTCYHVLVASPNCIMKYKIVGSKSEKILTDDGAPDDVGRTGWSHDFCPSKKVANQEATLDVKMQMLTAEYDHCWFVVSLWDWEAKPKQVAQLNKTKSAARNKVAAKVKKCQDKRKKCEKGCFVKVGGKKVADVNCKHQCFSDFGKCTGDIAFEGEIL